MPKNILVISPTPTHPSISGNRMRISSLVANLGLMGNNVHFLHIEKGEGDAEKMRKAWGEAYHRQKYKQPAKTALQKFLRKLKRLFCKDTRYIFSIDEWWDESSREMILGLHRQYNFDIVIVEYVFFSKALTYFPPGVFKIIDTHDVFTDRHKMFLKNNIRPKWYSTTRREEKKGLERADLVIAIQDSERSFFSGMVRVPVITVGHLTPTRPPKERGNSYKILYVASRNPNNLQSITWFLDEVLDRVSRAVPDVELLIAGTVCNELPDRERVTKLGIVDELGAAYDMADLVINPMLYGTGLKIKNVEALGYAKALVTTPVGAEGMEDGKDTSFLVASDPDEFSECIIRLFRDTDLYTSLTRSAYEYALRWNESTLGALKNAIDAIPPRR